MSFQNVIYYWKNTLVLNIDSGLVHRMMSLGSGRALFVLGQLHKNIPRWILGAGRKDSGYYVKQEYRLHISGLGIRRITAFDERKNEILEYSQLEPGLYVVGTPIGNLDDISIRALKTLKSVDRILCEDTRHTRTLLNHFGIQCKTESFHMHNEFKKQDEIINDLKCGQSIALVSDAGMPGINDPGSSVISAAARNGIRVIPIPGPSAFLTALVASGLLGETFLYCGFIAAKSSQRKQQFKKYKVSTSTLVFYVSPHALIESLEDAVAEFGGTRECCIAREITKIHEEFLRCTLEEALIEFQNRKPRGEFTLIISGSEEGKVEITDDVILQALALEIQQGLSYSAAAKAVAASLELPRKRVYELSLQIKSQ